ncbi:fasciclin domain-containing protein [Sphingomonas sinipercae]|uniref:Fasciclin domain-containing protein n=1 Tax=Sphingomonas sinipercae TaxID=2714944 RepID=A0A6G7ZKP9_9SPHN|nr:fasciclin domain-containing protein [Sphingomonas sinipercae]QIL01499.1 fasciclin domain-containing protein [Sphingomonas sinipercae]
MIKQVLPLVACAALALQGCDGKGADNRSTEQSSAAKDAAGSKTIAAGLDQNGAFFKALKSVGLDATLAGQGPYTVLVPADQALAGLPQGEAAQPQDRARVTGILTNHILPGTILAADIGNAIDAGKGKAQLATMGGGTITATKDGDTIVLTDAAGGKATVTGSDERFSNGVVHRISGVLQPAQAEKAAPAAG